MEHEHDGHPPSFWKTAGSATLLVVGAVAAYFLYTEHRAHVAGLLPYVLLAACPLMHLFMHHGHGGHGHSHGDRPAPTDKEPKP